MQKILLSKKLVFGMLVLFVILSITSAFNSNLFNYPKPTNLSNWLYVGCNRGGIKP